MVNIHYWQGVNPPLLLKAIYSDYFHFDPDLLNMLPFSEKYLFKLKKSDFKPEIHS